MSGSINKVILVGNLGKDPEIRSMQDGTKLANFSIATNETWKDKTTGEKRDRTEWHRVVVFNDRLAEICEKYLKKGMKIYLEGQLQTRKWTDPQGVEKYTTEVALTKFKGEITMLDNQGNRGEGGYQDSPFSSGPENNQGNQFGSSGNAPVLDDEIPF